LEGERLPPADTVTVVHARGRVGTMHVFLETDRLILRRFTSADVDHLVDLDGDPAVMRFITGGKPTPRETVRDDLLPRLLGHYEGYGFWAAVEKDGGEFVGWFHLLPEEGGAPDEPELGYRLRKPFWGNGYAAEGSRALIRKGFTELGARRVFATTMAVNLGSRRVMEKAGLEFVRVFHLAFDDPIEGTEHGEVEYALSNDEWERSERGQSTSSVRGAAKAHPFPPRHRGAEPGLTSTRSSVRSNTSG
jgi:RimJ/RimL family protein N-acetyltransferase